MRSLLLSISRYRVSEFSTYTQCSMYERNKQITRDKEKNSTIKIVVVFAFGFVVLFIDTLEFIAQY